MGNIRVALAQLNSVVGDLEGNVERIQEVLPNLDKEFVKSFGIEDGNLKKLKQDGLTLM